MEECKFTLEEYTVIIQKSKTTSKECNVVSCHCRMISDKSKFIMQKNKVTSYKCNFTLKKYQFTELQCYSDVNTNYFLFVNSIAETVVYSGEVAPYKLFMYFFIFREMAYTPVSSA